MSVETIFSKVRHTALLLVAALGLGGCATTADPTNQTLPEPVVSSLDLVHAGEQLEQGGDLNGALVDYVKALSTDANNADIHYHVARVHVALGSLRVAQEAFMRALSLNPNHVEALEGFGLLQLQLGQTEVARQALQKAATKDPKRWRTANGLGTIADLKGDHVKAQAQFRYALKLRPNEPELLNNLGFSLYQSGDFPAAIATLQQAISIAPTYQNAWSNLGLVLARRGEYDRSIIAFEHIMDPPAARYSTAYVCIGEHKYDAAERLLQAAITMSPSYYVAAHEALKRVLSEQATASALRR